MIQRGRKAWAVLAGAVVILLASAAGAAEPWPAKAVNILVGFQVGGTADQMARALTQTVSQKLGQPVVIQNKPGAGGGVAAVSVKDAPADGYNLIMTVASTYTFEPHVVKAQYALEDYVHIAAVAEFQEAFVALPDKPYKDFQGLIAWAKKEGVELKYGSFVQMDRVLTKYLSSKTGVKIVPVPMQGGAAVMPAVLGGHLDFGYSGGLHYPHVQAGKMIVLASLGEKRLDASPEVPSLKEMGYDISLINYLLLSAKKGTPPEIVAKLAAAAKEAASAPAYVDLVKNNLHLRPLYVGGAELGKALTDQSDGYKKLIATVGK